MSSLEEWLAKRATQERELNPLEQYQRQVQQEHSGSGMRTHLKLLDAVSNPYECFCRLKKYGTEVFDPSKMPLSWKGCGSCK